MNTTRALTGNSLDVVPVSFDEIHWEPSTEGVLYRGCSQGRFERVLGNTLNITGSVRYAGVFTTSNDAPARAYTFCTPHFVTPFTHARENAGIAQYYPFSRCPMLLAINAWPYEKQLLRSTKGDGIIIPGLINLEDVTVLFGSQVDRIAENTPRCFPRGVQNIASTLYVVRRENNARSDALEACTRRSPRREEARASVKTLLSGMKQTGSPEDESLLETYLGILKSKLR